MSRAQALLSHPPEYLGRRGSVLLLVGLIWVLRGASVLLVNPAPVPPRSLLLHLELPVGEAVTWIVCGVLAVIGATVNRPHWERWGFMALAGPPLLLGASNAWAFIVYAVTTNHYSTPDWIAWPFFALAGVVAVAGLALRLEGRRRGAESALVTAAILVIPGLLAALRVAYADTPEIGYGRGWVAAMTWLSILVLVVTIAGWQEPPRLRPARKG